MVMIPSPTLHGWTDNMDVMWVNTPFPKDVILLLCDENELESDDSEDQDMVDISDEDDDDDVFFNV